MHERPSIWRRLARAALAGGLAAVVSACETAPDLKRLAPTVQKLTTETPPTRHPDEPARSFPNINEAPDRPSVLRSAAEIEQIEKDLEAQGAAHVKDADEKITAEKPAPVTSIRPAAEPSRDPRPPVREEVETPPAGDAAADPEDAESRPDQQPTTESPS